MAWLDIIAPIPKKLILLFLFICWLFKACVQVVTLKSEKLEDIIPPGMDLSEPDPPAIRDICEEGTPHQG